MEAIRKYQDQLLAQAPFLKADNDYHNAIKEAFLQTPRHHFIRKFKDPPNPEWQIVTPENETSLLPSLYANKALSLYDESAGEYASSISQPYLVLEMLELLELKKGHTVFEIGASSGWNAALMGALVGEEGHVYSAEIIPEMAAQARENIERARLSNVSILETDAGYGHAAKAPFDRIIFTAATFDLPACFYHQLKDDGILLLILKSTVGGDLLLQLKKVGDHFESVRSVECSFVKMTGKYRSPEIEPILLEKLPEWEYLKDQEVSRTPLWWGGPKSIPLHFRTASFRSFLGIAEPGRRFIKEVHNAKSAGYFGMLDSNKSSLTIARDQLLITYGNESSRLRLLELLHTWIDIGMPAPTNFRISIHRSGDEVELSKKSWVVTREDSKFIWTL